MVGCLRVLLLLLGGGASSTGLWTVGDARQQREEELVVGRG